AVRQHGDLLDGLALLGVALHLPSAELPFEIVGRALERGRGDDAGLVADPTCHDRCGAAADRRGTRSVRAEAERRVVGIALDDFDVFRWDAQLLRDDLRKGGLM